MIIKTTAYKVELNIEIKQLIKDRNSMRKALQNRNIVELRSDIKKLNRIIRTKIKEQISEYWENTLKGIKTGNKNLNMY